MSGDVMINNWILDELGVPVEVIAITDGEIATSNNRGYLADEYYSPIPLTPDILEKAGFIPYEDSPKDYYLPDYSFCLEWGVDGYRQYHSGTIIGQPMKYLHQLQNRIYSVNQTELNIQL